MTFTYIYCDRRSLEGIAERNGTTPLAVTSIRAVFKSHYKYYDARDASILKIYYARRDIKPRERCNNARSHSNLRN